MGLRFDIVITGYVLSIPFLFLGIVSFFPIKIRWLTKVIFIYLSVVYVIVILILCADIPYFLQFYSRLTTASLLWLDDSKYMLGMIFSEPSFYIYFIVFVIIIVLFTWLLFRERKKFHNELSKKSFVANKWNIPIKILSFLIVGTLLMVGIRGRLNKKSPIRVGTAYFCNNQMLNKLALNPVFCFGYSLKSEMKEQNKIDLMNEEQAVQLAASFLSLPENDTVSSFVIAEWNKKNGSGIINNNVVIIIMESMGSYKLGKYDGPKNLTPNLNRIISNSLYFDNIYTAGIHTFTGIYSTLFSFPTLFTQQPLKERMDVPHNGIAKVLKNQGYATLFFTTHDSQFDNVGGFLKANGYDHIYSDLDYPNEWILSTNGVPDHKMFEYAIPVLNKISEKGQRFFTAFMTTSDHAPLIIPENIEFEPFSDNIDQQIIEYADWSIGYFIKLASKQEWFNNTTFVLIADHGLTVGYTYDLPLSYFHTPLIVYTPSSPQICDTLHNLGGQIDVAPTILGLLNVPYENNTMGINLFKNKRPFMYFCSDDKIGCLDNEYYLIIRPENMETLYRYEHLKTENYIDSFTMKVDSMKQYTYSMMQATQAIMNQRIRPTKNKTH
ncbi:LTA synthase family protein [Bacteroidota bacterium]